MAALTLRKAIERGSVSFATTDTSKTVTLATALTTDTSKTILLFNVRCASNGAINYQVTGRIISTTQIQFDRAATPSVGCDVEYQVIEFSAGISVQHLYFNQWITTTIDTTITSVDTSKSFVILTNSGSGTTFGSDDCFYGDLTSSTNLRTVGVATQGTAYIAAQVVTIDDATVQKIGTTTWTTGATQDITVTTIDPTKTFWFFGCTYNATMNADQWPYLSYINSTTLRFTKAASSATNTTVLLTYVVSLSSGVTVQNISTTIASGNSTVSPAITSVTVNNTALNICGMYQRQVSANEADDQAGTAEMTLSSLSATAFTATRASTPAIAATTNVQVLEFVSSSAGPVIPVFMKLYRQFRE